MLVWATVSFLLRPWPHGEVDESALQVRGSGGSDAGSPQTVFRETPETSEQGLQCQTTGTQTVAPRVSIYEAFYTLQRFPETWFILCESGEWIPVLLSLQVPVRSWQRGGA